jgi:hypothetical protein
MTAGDSMAAATSGMNARREIELTVRTGITPSPSVLRERRIG